MNPGAATTFANNMAPQDAGNLLKQRQALRGLGVQLGTGNDAPLAARAGLQPSAAAQPSANTAPTPQALQSMIQSFSSQNPPQKYKGRTATDPATGVKLVSDGMVWKRA
jgi:hypothetical protein